MKLSPAELISACRIALKIVRQSKERSLDDAMTNSYTHCGHGKRYTADCRACDEVWANEVTLPNARQLVQRLMRFYSVDDLRELLFIQSGHIEKLQAKLPPAGDMRPLNPRKFG